MFNKDVFEKMSEKFGEEKMPLLCEAFAYMFDLGTEDAKIRKIEADYSHDRDWWRMKFLELNFKAEDCNKSDENISSE